MDHSPTDEIFERVTSIAVQLLRPTPAERTSVLEGFKTSKEMYKLKKPNESQNAADLAKKLQAELDTKEAMFEEGLKLLAIAESCERMELAASEMIKAFEWKLIVEKLQARFAEHNAHVAAAADEARAKKRARTVREANLRGHYPSPNLTA